MRILLLYIIILFFISCKKSTSNIPIWVNKSDTIYAPNFKIEFTNIPKEAIITINGFMQPLPLETNYSNNTLTAFLHNKKGIIEGPTEICLTTDKTNFYFSTYLKNEKIDTIFSKDYRSSKTVNPDSSLIQQSITHQIDQYRNLQNFPSTTKYFKEQLLNLSPKIGIFRAQQNIALSSYYIQAGSTNTFSISSKFNKEKKRFEVTTSNLKDKYGNQVADGTLLSFIYTDNIETLHMESTLQKGTTTVFIPLIEGKKWQLFAKANETISNTITLNP